MANEDTYQHNSTCDVDCDEYVKTDCVIYQESIDYLGLEAGASSTEIINKLAQTVEYLQQQVNVLNSPTVPKDLSSANITETSVDLSWTASFDRDGIASYNIYKDGVLEANSVTTAINISGLTTLTPYTFVVSAVDTLGDESDASAAHIVTTI